LICYFGKLGLALGALALLASPALAQGQTQGRGGFGGGAAGFLMAPNVQKDLKLTDAQVNKIQETLREMRGTKPIIRPCATPRRMCGG
jgi:Spy/CpxP family protein refolding chaperone